MKFNLHIGEIYERHSSPIKTTQTLKLKYSWVVFKVYKTFFLMRKDCESKQSNFLFQIQPDHSTVVKQKGFRFHVTKQEIFWFGTKEKGIYPQVSSVQNF